MKSISLSTLGQRVYRCLGTISWAARRRLSCSFLGKNGGEVKLLQRHVWIHGKVKQELGHDGGQSSRS